MTKDFNQHKITSDIKRIKERKKVLVEVAERMKIPKFGICAGMSRGTMEEGVITISKEEIRIVNRANDIEQDMKEKLLDSINNRKNNVLREMREQKERENQEKLNKLLNSQKPVVVKKTYRRENTIKVSGYNPRYDREDLRKIFEESGRIRNIYIPIDRYTNQLKNLAFIDYEQSMGVKNAIEKFNDFAKDGCVLSVELAENK
jgi:RNA recognition motif-containing protein